MHHDIAMCDRSTYLLMAIHKRALEYRAFQWSILPRFGAHTYVQSYSLQIPSSLAVVLSPFPSRSSAACRSKLKPNYGDFEPHTLSCTLSSPHFNDNISNCCRTALDIAIILLSPTDLFCLPSFLFHPHRHFDRLSGPPYIQLIQLIQQPSPPQV
jgi:hypothetical protein